MDHQAYVRIRSSQEGGELHAAYSQAYEDHLKAQITLAETRMRLAFHDQRLAGHIMQTSRTDVVDMGSRVSWSHTQHAAFKVIEECRLIIRDCTRQLRWGTPSYSYTLLKCHDMEKG